MVKSSNKRKIIWSAREKRQIICRGKNVRIATYLSETMQGQRKWHTFNLLKGKQNLSTLNSLSMKTVFEKERLLSDQNLENVSPEDSCFETYERK